MSFSADIARYAKKAKLEADDAVVAVCSKITEGVIEKTPFLSGRLRGNWYATIDSDTSETSETRTAAEAKTDGQNKAREASGTVFSLTNNLPYAYRIEYLGWSKIKAPAGMARVTVAEVANKLNTGNL